MKKDKTDIKNIDKNDCLKFIKSTDVTSIHPLLNTFNVWDNLYKDKPDMCHVLPQLNKNILGDTIVTTLSTNKLKENIKSDSLDINNLRTDSIDNLVEPEANIKSDSINTNDLKSTDDLMCIDPVMNFSMPINNSNFLDIVFKITSVIDLYNWLLNSQTNNKEIEIIETVFDLFWEYYYHKIDDELDLFIKTNQKLIYIILNKDISLEITKNIVNRLIKNNFGKKINYLSKIKKYLTKYI